MPDYGNPLWLSPVSVPLSLILNLEKQFSEMLCETTCLHQSPHCCWYGPATLLKIQQTRVWLHKRLIDWRLLCSLYSQRGGGCMASILFIQHCKQQPGSHSWALRRMHTLWTSMCLMLHVYDLWSCDRSLLWCKAHKYVNWSAHLKYHNVK